MRLACLFLAATCAGSAWAGYRVQEVVPLDLGALAGAGQVSDPSLSPQSDTLGFELLGGGGDTLEVYTAPVAGGDGGLAVQQAPEPVLERRADDPFALGAAAQRAVSEHLSWGPPKRGRPRFVVAATRKASPRGASQVNFDLHLTEPGRVRFLTDHPGNDAQPAFSPDGEMLAFTSGRTGQGDLYVYHFYAEREPEVRLTFEAGGSELYPTWSPDGERLAFVAHLGSEDHIVVLDGVPELVRTPEARRQAAARRASRNLTAGWRVSCLAPSFSPDGKWLAFYAREGAGDRADLYVVPVAGGTPRKILSGGLPETRGGPRWGPGSDGLFAVREDADRFNPLLWVPLAEDRSPILLATGTELNADPRVAVWGGVTHLLFTAQGAGTSGEKRWRRIYVARLAEEDRQ